jgi:anti-sigma factor RsiW
MNELEYKRLREIGWRRKLTAQEEISLQAYLLTHPEAQADWDDDLALTHALDRLPNAPLSSNFTSQVMLALDLEIAAEERQHGGTRGWRWWLHQFLPKAALGVLTVSLGALGFTQYQRHLWEERAQQTIAVTRVAGFLPEAEMWQDFEAIRRLNTSAPATSDDELLAALK